MANCSSCNGCNGCGSRSCTRVGALGALCRTGCRRYPFYTGPCPSAPCTDHCGNCSSNNCCNNCCGSSYAAANGCGYSYGNYYSSNNCCNNCNSCNNCNNCCGCNNCGCSDGCDSCSCCDCDDCDDCDRRRNRGRGYGIFTLGGPVHLSAGGMAEFTPRDVNPDYFSCRGDAIVIRRPGLYRAVLTADIPKFTEADTVLGLDLNGRRIPAAEMALDAADCASAMNYTADAIFEASAGDKLRMCASNALNVSCSSGRNLFKLTIYRL